MARHRQPNRGQQKAKRRFPVNFDFGFEEGVHALIDKRLVVIFEMLTIGQKKAEMNSAFFKRNLVEAALKWLNHL